MLVVVRSKKKPRVRRRMKISIELKMQTRKNLPKKGLKAVKKAQLEKVTRRTIGRRLTKDNLSSWLRMRPRRKMSSHHSI